MKRTIKKLTNIDVQEVCNRITFGGLKVVMQVSDPVYAPEKNVSVFITMGEGDSAVERYRTYNRLQTRYALLKHIDKSLREIAKSWLNWAMRYQEKNIFCYDYKHRSGKFKRGELARMISANKALP